MKTMNEQWQSFLEMAVPSDAGPTQVIITKRAFYAGARAFYAVLDAIAEDGDELTQQEAEDMTALEKELEDFVAAVEAGNA